MLTRNVFHTGRLAETVREDLQGATTCPCSSSADTVQVVRSKAKVRAIALSPKAPKKDLAQLALALSSNAVEVPCLLPSACPQGPQSCTVVQSSLAYEGHSALPASMASAHRLSHGRQLGH